jgi:hypothetical protein
MRKMLSIAAAVVAAVGFSAGMALADDSDADQGNGAFTLDTLVPNTSFDLGVDVGGVPRTRGAVQAYLGTLLPEQRTSILRACQNYMTYPSSAQERETIAFCVDAIGG